MTRGENFHPYQDSDTTLRAQAEVCACDRHPKIAAIRRLWEQQGERRCQQPAAEIQFGGAVAVGQETVAADALKAGRKGVLQEAADELLGREGHHLLLLPVAIIFPLEGYLTTFQRHQSAIGDGNEMRVAAHIL